MSTELGKQGKKSKKAAVYNKAPDGPGQLTLPNPGEYPPDGEAMHMPMNSLGEVPPQGNRAGGNPWKPGDPGFMDDGARVGYLRNMEFSAGGRSQLVSTGTESTIRPNISPTTGQVQVSGMVSDDMTAGKLGQTPATAGANPHPGTSTDRPDASVSKSETLDTVKSSGPDRRSDKRGV
ncbi:MAG: hypothetical protein ACR2M0_00700 [Chloroflexia bacterium]